MRKFGSFGTGLILAAAASIGLSGRAIIISPNSTPHEPDQAYKPPRLKKKRVKASHLGRGRSRYMPHQGEQEIARRIRQEQRNLERRLPVGLSLVEGLLSAECHSCGSVYPWPAEIEEFGHLHNYCGGSERCIP